MSAAGKIETTITHSPIVRFSVNFDLSLAELAAIGKYDNADLKNFKDVHPELSGTHEYEGCLFNIHPWGRWAKMAELIAAQDAEHAWAAANPWPLIAYGNAFPLAQVEFSKIFGIGTKLEVSSMGQAPLLSGGRSHATLGGLPYRHFGTYEWEDRLFWPAYWLGVRLAK